MDTNTQPPADLLENAKAALALAYAPYSKFTVGACLRSSNGTLYRGCNVENAAYPMCQCAEANAISNMVVAGERAISELLILIPGDRTCAPCGFCRQCIFEFSTKDTIVHLCTVNGKYELHTMGELLPHAFGPDYLETT